MDLLFGTNVSAVAVVRGKEGPKGTMSAALLTLIRWAQTDLGLQEIGVRVRSDNPAIDFYRKLGFRMIKQIPLRKTESTNKTLYCEDASLKTSDLLLIHMRYGSDSEVD